MSCARAAAVALTVTCACAPFEERALELPEGARSAVVVWGREDALEAVAVETSAVILPARAGELVVVRSFTRPLAELALEPGPLLLREQDSWPLPAGVDRVIERGGLAEADALAILGALSVARPPCARFVPRHLPLGQREQVQFLLPLGDGVLFGTEGSIARDVPAAVWFASATQAPQRIPELTFPMPFGLSVPRAFPDEDGVVVLWTDRLEGPYALHLVTPSLELRRGPPLGVASSSVAAGTKQLASFREAGRRVVLARHYRDVVYRLREDASDERPLEALLPEPLDPVCDSNFTRSVLELESLDRALVGFRGNRLRYFELDAPGGPRPAEDLVSVGERYCGASLLHASPEVTVLALELPRDGHRAKELRWRGSSGRFETFPGQPSTYASAALGRDLFIGAPRAGVLHFDFDERRPDVAPRECSPAPEVAFEVWALAASAGAMFAGSLDASELVMLERVP